MLEKCNPEGVKPLLLILQYIEVAYPVNETTPAAKPAKLQAEQLSKKFAQGAHIPRKFKHVHPEYTCIEKMQTMHEA